MQKRKGIIREGERTIAVLVEKAEGLLELRDLIVRQLIRHFFSTNLLSVLINYGSDFFFVDEMRRRGMMKLMKEITTRSAIKSALYISYTNYQTNGMNEKDR